MPLFEPLSLSFLAQPSLGEERQPARLRREIPASSWYLRPVDRNRTGEEAARRARRGFAVSSGAPPEFSLRSLPPNRQLTKAATRTSKRFRSTRRSSHRKKRPFRSPGGWVFAKRRLSRGSGVGVFSRKRPLRWSGAEIFSRKRPLRWPSAGVFFYKRPLRRESVTLFWDKRPFRQAGGGVFFFPNSISAPPGPFVAHGMSFSGAGEGVLRRRISLGASARSSGDENGAMRRAGVPRWKPKPPGKATLPGGFAKRGEPYCRGPGLPFAAAAKAARVLAASACAAAAVSSITIRMRRTVPSAARRILRTIG